MAESRVTAVVPLNGTNYPTWKIQCRMALMKEGLWRIVTGEETAPVDGAAAERVKFASRRDRALATVVLSVDTSLLYLIGNPEDPVVVWKKLADQFEKKTWATRLDLRRKLHALRLKDRDLAQDHIKAMSELFDALSVAGETVSEEDRVVYLLASLPESYAVLVTALEANEEVPKLEVVIERILHEERKSKDKIAASSSAESAMTSRKSTRPKPKCHHCGKLGHIKRFCRDLKQDTESQKEKKGKTAHQKEAASVTRASSDSEGSVLISIADHALSASSKDEQCAWIIDSGATSHMCRDKKVFTALYQLQDPIDVVLGDGRALTAIGRGDVVLNMLLPSGESKTCTLYDVLYVPDLSYNLLSVSKASRRGKVVKFKKSACYILDRKHTLVAKATREGGLYQLNCRPNHERAALAEQSGSKEDIWHKRFGHLGVKSLQRLSREGLAVGFDYDTSSQLTFCEACPQGKQHRNKFPASSTRADEPLGLVHSDVCGKINVKSLGGAEYFMSFIDDKTRFTWVYPIRTKDQVFKKFCEWKTLVEKSSGKKLKAIRTDNGGEYTSREFQEYLTEEGIRHERTIPKTPEQNGVAERMNRTLVEATRSMLADSNLPHTLWAEALSTAAYLRNRCPTKAVVGMTPFEAWSGEKPCVNGLRVFGCQAYVHIPKDERKKLDSKSKKCVLLGYGEHTKGYRLYNPATGKVLHSRDVIFNEAKYGFESSGSQEEPERRVYLEYSDEPLETVDPPEATDPPAPPSRRSGRVRTHPDYYGFQCSTGESEVKEPKSVSDALKSQKWVNAMQSEIDSLHEHDVWELVELPEGRKCVGSKWVFKVKKNADGSIERNKARLVAQGYSQEEGLDYDETFSPVVRSESVRSVIALACKKGLKLHQMDITTAFLNGDLKEEVYMKQPKGFCAEGQEHLVCRLKRSLYGLKQSPRCWNQALDTQLKSMGFKQSVSDPCIYTSKTDDGLFILGVYVDDILLAGESEQKLEQVKTVLGQQFLLKDMGELNYFLGVSVKQNPEQGKIWIGQPSYTEAVLKKFGMEHSKPTSTPVAPGTKLMRATEQSEMCDATIYQSAVGSLLYLSGWTRPDIAFAVSSVARFCSSPTKAHWSAVKRILRYLKGTTGYGLLYSENQDDESLIGYSDADWAGDANDRKSTSGYFFMISGAPVSWRSRKQSCVALSTAEAEYVAMASAAQEATWMRQLLEDLHLKQSKPTVINEDNQSAIAVARNPQSHSKMKHIDIRYHFIREKVLDDTVELQYCPTDDMLADILTKGLTPDKFSKLRELAGVVDLSAI